MSTVLSISLGFAALFTLFAVLMSKRDWRYIATLKADKASAEELRDGWKRYAEAQLKAQVLMSRKLIAVNEQIDTLIESIWGSRTIHRNLRDVFTMICELRDRLAASERTSRGLASVVEKQDAELKEARTASNQWEDQARKNAEFIIALMENHWAIRDASKLEERPCFRIYDAFTQAGPIGQGSTPEGAIHEALAMKSEASASRNSLT